MGRNNRRKRGRAVRNSLTSNPAPSRRKRMIRTAVRALTVLAIVAGIILINREPLKSEASINRPRQPVPATLARYTKELAELAPTSSNDTATYTYDALGRRVSKTVNGVTTVYVSSLSPFDHSEFASQEIAEYTANSPASLPQRKFVYGEYIDEPIAMTNVSGSTETKYYYHQNNLYSTAALTNQSGQPVERYAYSAYGKPTILDANATPIPHPPILSRQPLPLHRPPPRHRDRPPILPRPPLRLRPRPLHFQRSYRLRS